MPFVFLFLNSFLMAELTARDKSFLKPITTAAYIHTLEIQILGAGSQDSKSRILPIIHKEFISVFGSSKEILDGFQVAEFTKGQLRLTFLSDKNHEDLFKNVVTRIFSKLEGKVHARGKWAFMKTKVQSQDPAYLEVVTEKNNAVKTRRLTRVIARQIPLSDLLHELNRKTHAEVSYLLPTRCGKQTIDWTFDAEVRGSSLPLERALEVLAGDASLSFEQFGKQYRFAEQCRVSGFLGKREARYESSWMAKFPSNVLQGLSRQVGFGIR